MWLSPRPRLLVLLGGLFIATRALAAPDEAALGKAEGFAEPRALKRAAFEPAIQYMSPSQTRGLDDDLSRNRTTGLILKGDTILAERYQDDRKPEHRMTSYSMATTFGVEHVAARHRGLRAA
jgi:hypothetical protein